MLITAHPAGEVPLPWHNPCMLILIPPPTNVLESPKPVRRKNFMFSIAPNIDSIAVLARQMIGKSERPLHVLVYCSSWKRRQAQLLQGLVLAW
jgi:hypothetical protein